MCDLFRECCGVQRDNNGYEPRGAMSGACASETWGATPSPFIAFERVLTPGTACASYAFPGFSPSQPSQPSQPSAAPAAAMRQVEPPASVAALGSDRMGGGIVGEMRDEERLEYGEQGDFAESEAAGSDRRGQRWGGGGVVAKLWGGLLAAAAAACGLSFCFGRISPEEQRLIGVLLFGDSSEDAMGGGGRGGSYGTGRKVARKGH